MITVPSRRMLAAAVLACLAPAGAAAQVPPPAPPVTIESPQRQPETRPDDVEQRLRLYRHRPIVRIAQNYTVPAGEIVREVQVVLGDLRIDGRVDDDVVVVLGSATVSATGEVGGTLSVIGGSATIDPAARVHRDLVVVGGTLNTAETFSPMGYQVVVGSPWLGALLQDIAPWLTRGLLWGRLIVPGLGWVWLVVGIFFLIYLALNTVFDRTVGDSATLIASRPLSVFMAGFLVMLLSLPALALVAATVIGLVLVPFIVCALIVVALIGKTAVARALGRSVVRSDAGRFSATVAFTIGFVLLTLAYMVPVLGFVTWALTTVMGFGAAAMTFRGLLRRERPAPVAPPPSPSLPPSPPAPPSSSGPDVDTGLGTTVAPPPPPAPLPRPAFAEGLAQYPRATFLDRVAAFALDAILVAIAAAILDLDSVGRNEGSFFLLLLAYHVAFWAWKGTTLGGIICNVRVIRTDGSDLRFADSLVRGLSSIFSIVALGIGCFWMLQDSERQMWHDKIAGTLVVKVPRELALV